ncbi:MAG TPA: C4-type zinc ribbon domain-containing protein [Geobacteraceae bacterium]|nr:C4-type zinc ribbon domain-containing protein [Geobacteraceae bacterium]
MRKSLKMLGELQEIDLKIDSFKGEKEGMQQELDILDGKLAEAESAIAVKNAEMAVSEEEKRGLEESLAMEVENIARSEGRIKEIKTQKEYQAVSKEITVARKQKAEMEEQILQKIGRVDELKSEIAGLEENRAALQANIAEQKAEVQARIDTLEEGIAKDNAVRDEIVKGLPSSVIRRYTLLREQRRGLAVAEAKGGSCLGCNMNLPPQLYNSLFRGDDLITCPHCQRMLLLHQEEK